MSSADAPTVSATQIAVADSARTNKLILTSLFDRGTTAASAILFCTLRSIKKHNYIFWSNDKSQFI
ncbi:hypothetical protein [Bradyrhizobium sp. USDA 3696]